jgi:hypothetical protein
LQQEIDCLEKIRELTRQREEDQSMLYLFGTILPDSNPLKVEPAAPGTPSEPGIGWLLESVARATRRTTRRKME